MKISWLLLLVVLSFLILEVKSELEPFLSWSFDEVNGTFLHPDSNNDLRFVADLSRLQHGINETLQKGKIGKAIFIDSVWLNLAEGIENACLGIDVSTCNGDITLSFWLFVNKWGFKDNNTILRIKNANESNLILIKRRGDDVLVEYRNSSLISFGVPRPFWKKWAHGLITWSARNKTIKVYLDGIPQNHMQPTNENGRYGATNLRLVIGDQWGPSFYLDELKVYNAYVSSVQAAKIYSEHLSQSEISQSRMAFAIERHSPTVTGTTASSPPTVIASAQSVTLALARDATISVVAPTMTPPPLSEDVTSQRSPLAAGILPTDASTNFTTTIAKTTGLNMKITSMKTPTITKSAPISSQAETGTLNAVTVEREQRTTLEEAASTTTLRSSHGANSWTTITSVTKMESTSSGAASTSDLLASTAKMSTSVSQEETFDWSDAMVIALAAAAAIVTVVAAAAVVLCCRRKRANREVSISEKESNIGVTNKPASVWLSLKLRGTKSKGNKQTSKMRTEVPEFHLNRAGCRISIGFPIYEEDLEAETSF